MRRVRTGTCRPASWMAVMWVVESITLTNITIDQ